MQRRITAFILSLALLFSLTPRSLASDIDNHWAKNYILELVDKGIMQGNGSGNYRPDEKITRAEFAALINRTFGFTKESDTRFSDVTYSDDWKSQAVTRAATLGYMLGTDGKANPDGFISRQEAAVMLIRVLKLPLETAPSTFKDDSSVSSWAKAYISTAQKYGIVTAMPDGSFQPTASLSRAQAATVLVRAMGELYNKAGTYEGGEISGNATISVTGVTLKNTTIDGNLYLTEGIGTGAVNLQNVKVKGLTFVCGGGTEDGTTAQDSSFAGVVTVSYPNNYLSGLRFALKDSSSVTSAVVKVPAILDTTGLTNSASGFKSLSFDVSGAQVALNGSFGDLALSDPTTALSIDSGTVSSLTLSQATPISDQKYQITVSSGGTVGSLTINSPAEISGDGTLSAVTVNASDSSIGSDVKVNTNKITLLNGITIKVGNVTLAAYGNAAALSGLVLKSADGASVIPMDAFSASTTSYNAYSGAGSARVYPTADTGSVITVNGTTVASGSYLTVSASVGASIRIQVSCDGKNSTVYTVTMAEPVDAALSSLEVINAGSSLSAWLSPSFDPSVTSYTVYSSVTNLKINAGVKGSSLNVKIGDNAAVAGGASANITLPPSNISVPIVVSNGIAGSKTYTVNIIRKPTAGAVYLSSSSEGSGTTASWTVTLSNPTEGDTFTIADKSFIVGKTDKHNVQVSRTDALSDIAQDYSENNNFVVTADGSNLIFTNKTTGALSSSSQITCNVGTVTRTEGANRRNGMTTITVNSVPTQDLCPLSLVVGGKTYRICYSSSDVTSNYDILISSTTTAAQLANLLDRAFVDGAIGGLVGSLSGTSIVVSDGDISAPDFSCDSGCISAVKNEGSAATAETFVLQFSKITEGQIISITVSGITTQFEAHDSVLVSVSNPAAGVKSAFYNSNYNVTTSGEYIVIFQSCLLGSAGNSQAFETSGSIVSAPAQTTVGKDTKLGSASIIVSKIPKYGDTLTINSETYVFSDSSDGNGIDISGASSVNQVASAIKAVIGEDAKLSGNKITITSATAEAPVITFSAS